MNENKHLAGLNIPVALPESRTLAHFATVLTDTQHPIFHPLPVTPPTKLDCDYSF